MSSGFPPAAQVLLRKSPTRARYFIQSVATNEMEEKTVQNGRFFFY